MSKMRRRWRDLTCAGLLFAGLLAAPGVALYAAYPAKKTDAKDEIAEVCQGEKLGTTVNWYEDMKEASRLAREQGKLLFVIHVSGNFAREEFT